MCTLEERGEIFFLTLTGLDEHRINPTLISQIRSSLKTVSLSSPKALITTSSGKFFSNGFDLAWAAKAKEENNGETPRDRLSLMVELFKPVVKDFMEVPCMTIAAVNGHAAAAGMMLALCHDYIFMNGERGVLYMSEIDIGMTFPPYFTVMMRSKIGSPAVRRNILLKAAKIRAAEAAAVGIVEAACKNEEKTLESAIILAEQLIKRKWNGEVYKEIRKDLYPELCGLLGLESKSIVVSSKL